MPCLPFGLFRFGPYQRFGNRAIRFTAGVGLPPALLALSLTLAPGRDLSAAQQAVVTIGPTAFQVELAQTEDERRRGLMFRQHLPAGQGMLFVQAPGRAEFWMKNTLIPLDLLYFDAQGTLIEILPRVQPCRQLDCPTYPSRSAAVSYILEINGGEAARRALQVGDPLALE